MDLYLHLFHGRANPDEDLETWGSVGPVIGPLKRQHGVYATEIHLEFAPEASHEQIVNLGLNPFAPKLCYVGDLLMHQGVYYGDYTVFCATPEEMREKTRDAIQKGSSRVY